MPSAHQVRAKSRLAVRRREDDVEQEEIEGGEINLIPYLDIVTNLMLFLLASVSANIIFGHINTTLPDQGAPPPSQVNDPGKKPDEQPLLLTVAVTKNEIRLFSLSGLEGTNKEPKLTVPRIGRPGDACDGDYLCETDKCIDQRCAVPTMCSGKPKLCAAERCDDSCVTATDTTLTPVYDYRKLNAALAEIAGRRWKGKFRKADTYQALLMADASVPYGTLISVISAMRCPMAPFGKPTETCFLPTADETLKKADNPVDDKARLYDTDRTPYDPTQQALFPDVVFSGGFR